MSAKEHKFVFSFTVSDEFLAVSPDAARFIEAEQQAIAERTTAAGPRGGTYVLTGPPEEWRTAKDYGMDWVRGVTRYSTRRTGRYVRPSRAPRVPSDDFTLGTFSMPVVDGAVTLPDGRRVGTDSKFVVVPVRR